MNTPRQAILIAGMHRSGTSALARVLSLLGAELGPDLTPAAPGNPRGYWEERRVIELNDECLRLFGLTWDDPTPLPEDWQNAPWMPTWRDALATYLRQAHHSAPLIVIKDPRISRLLPVWAQVLASLEISAHVIVAVRRPEEVALSLARRDGLTAAHAKRLWLTYTLEAEYASRGLSRIFTSFTELLADWQALADRMQSQLSIKWPVAVAVAAPKIESFLDAGMRHTAPEAPIETDATQISLLAATVYAYVRASSEDHVVPARCWDEAKQSLHQQSHDARPVLTHGHAATPPALAVVANTLGHWEPAEVISEIVQARLYYRHAGESAAEHRHVAAVVPTAVKPMHAEFTLPTDAVVDFIRFDPAMRRGIYRVLEISINGRKLTSAVLKLSAVHERLLPADGCSLLCFFCDDDDPFVEIDVRALRPTDGTPMHIEFAFECDSLFDRLGREFERRDRVLNESVIQAQQKIAQVSTALSRSVSIQQQVQKELAKLVVASEATQRRDKAELQGKLLTAGWGPSGASQTRTPRTSLSAGAISLRPAPSPHLEFLAQDPGTNMLWWRSIGADPFFSLELPGNTALAPGWYVLGMHFVNLANRPLQPMIDIDYGDGFGASKGTDLPVSSGARQRLLLRFERPVYGLRFCPDTCANTEFLLSPLHLRRLAHAEALLRLGLPWLRNTRSDDDDPARRSSKADSS